MPSEWQLHGDGSSNEAHAIGNSLPHHQQQATYLTLQSQAHTTPSPAMFAHYYRDAWPTINRVVPLSQCGRTDGQID